MKMRDTAAVRPLLSAFEVDVGRGAHHTPSLTLERGGIWVCIMYFA